MLHHPLCKNFLRTRPRLYLIKDPALIGDGYDKDPHFAALNNKTIEMNKAGVDVLTAAEAKAIIAHELGHILATDTDSRRLFSSLDIGDEDRADKIAVILCGDAEIYKSALYKIYETARQESIRSGTLEEYERYEKDGSYCYRPLQDRINQIDADTCYKQSGEPLGK